MPNVSSMAPGQSQEVCNQIENACKEQGVNPEEITSGLIRENFFFTKTNEYLLDIKRQKSTPIVQSKYLKLREGLLSISATTNSVYDEKKWRRELFTGGIDNYTDENWGNVTSGCIETSAGKMKAYDLIKYGTYSQFIKDEPQNFFQGIEKAFQAIEDNPALVQEVLKQYRHIHVPFINASGARFVARVFNLNRKLLVGVNRRSDSDVWRAEYGGVISVINVILFPEQSFKN